MKKIPDGYQNEFLFVLEFNNKKIKQLNPMFRNVIDDLFPEMNDDLVVKSWRNHYSYQKADIFIKVDNNIKTISIKKGSRNSVHAEKIDTFKSFLHGLGINDEIISYYEDFHYGRDKNDSSKILNSAQYVEKYSKEIEKINEAFSKLNTEKVVDRFILSGTKLSCEVDGIIYGTPIDFLWINKKGIKKVVKTSIQNKSNGVHIGCLFIQPLNRCINGNEKYLKYRDYIQIKWYSLFDDIIWYMNEKVKNNLS